MQSKKLITTISMICLMAVLLVVGVWALTEVQFKVGGDIEYAAPEPATEDVSEYPTLQFYVTDSTNKEVLVQQNQSNKPSGELVIPSKVLSNGVEYTVTSIAVAEGQTLLSTVFSEKEIQLPQMRIEEMPSSAFEYCTKITRLVIPDSVTSIESHAFSGCTGLTSIKIGSGVKQWDYAFPGISNLTSVTISNGVTSIGHDAFYYCTSLTSITIPDSVTNIGSQAFYGCTGLTSVTIGNGVTSIEYSAFYSCTSLTSITIPDSVTSIGGSAFGGCTSLTNISVDSGNSVYDSRNNCNAIIETATNTLIAGCKNTIIPNTVTSIGSSAFSGCTGLTSITIPDSVTSIASSTFYGCTGLTSITIPDSVTSIGDRAFNNCKSLAEVNVKATKVPTGGSTMFYNCSSSLVIYVPTASVSAYQVATNWSTYSSKIQGKSF